MNFRRLEEKGVVVLFWEVAEHLMSEPGRLANSYLNLMENDLDELHDWEISYHQFLFRTMLRNMILNGAGDDPHDGGNGDDGPRATAGTATLSLPWRPQDSHERIS